jgi:ribosomal protein L10
MGWFDSNYNPAVGGLLYGAGQPPMARGQMYGGLLQQLGSGLLAYGTGSDIGDAMRQSAAFTEQQRNDQLQRQALTQQIRQSAVTNSLSNAQSLAMLNWKLGKQGLPPVSLTDLMNNPDKASAALYNPATPTQPNAAPMATPTASGGMAPLPAGLPSVPQPLPTQNAPAIPAQPGNPYSPLMAGPSMPMPKAPTQPVQAQPMAPSPQPVQPRSTGLDGGLTPEVAQMIQSDALYNKDYAEMELNLVKAGMPYQQAQSLVQSLGKDKQYIGPDGTVQNMPGAVNAGAQVAGANAYATSQGQLPAETAKIGYQGVVNRENDRAKAAITPTTIQIPDPQRPGMFITLNTNNLAASSGSLGAPVYNAEQTANLGKLADYKTALTDSANEAQGQNVQLNQMLDTMKNFDPGKLAPYKATVQAWFNSLGMSSAESDKALSSYQEFSKVATKQATTQARQMGAREAASIVTMMVNNNPNATMTPQAIGDMVNAMKATNDYTYAKNQAADEFYRQNGTLSGFDAQWQQQHPPVAFLAPYLRPDQLTGELGKQALPYLSQQQLIDLRSKLAGQRTQ